MSLFLIIMMYKVQNYGTVRVVTIYRYEKKQ